MRAETGRCEADGPGVSVYAKPNEVNLDALEGTWHSIASRCSTRSRFDFCASQPQFRPAIASYVSCPITRLSCAQKGNSLPSALPPRQPVARTSGESFLALSLLSLSRHPKLMHDQLCRALCFICTCNGLAYMRPFYIHRCHSICYRLHSTVLAVSTPAVVQQPHPPSPLHDLSITLLQFQPVGRTPIIETSPSVTERAVNVAGYTKSPMGPVLAIMGHKLRVEHVLISLMSHPRERHLGKYLTRPSMRLDFAYCDTVALHPRQRQPKPRVPTQSITDDRPILSPGAPAHTITCD